MKRSFLFLFTFCLVLAAFAEKQDSNKIEKTGNSDKDKKMSYYGGNSGNRNQGYDYYGNYDYYDYDYYGNYDDYGGNYGNYYGGNFGSYNNNYGGNYGGYGYDYGGGRGRGPPGGGPPRGYGFDYGGRGGRGPPGGGPPRGGPPGGEPPRGEPPGGFGGRHPPHHPPPPPPPPFGRKRRETTPSDFYYSDYPDYNNPDYYYDYDDVSDDYATSLSEIPVEKCLNSKMTDDQVVDIVFDLSPELPELVPSQFIRMLGLNLNGHRDLANMLVKDSSDLVHILSYMVDSNKFQLILRNQSTRYYLDLPATTPGAGKSESTLGNAVRWAMQRYFSGNGTVGSKSRPNDKKAVFTIAIADGMQTGLTEELPDESVILDLFGNFAAANPGYTKRNVLIAYPQEIIFLLPTTVRYMICQALGGISH